MPQPVVFARSSRSERRQAERRQRRRRLSLAILGAVLVAAGAVAVVLSFGGKSTPSTPAGPQRTQATALVALTNDDGSAAQSALLAHDTKSKQGVELLVPSRLITDVCGYGSQQFGRIFALPHGDALARGALANLLGGVTIDGSWVLTRSALASVIDAVHGVTVDVDADVIERTSGGTKELVVSSGPGQHLTGRQAVEFATYTAPGEDASAALDRFHTVLDALLAALPQDPAAAAAVLTPAGASVAVLTPARLAALLAGLAADNRANQVLPSDLPVVSVDSGGGPAAYRIDETKTAQLVDTNLAGSLPRGSRQPKSRVFVQNGVGKPGLVESACTRLVAAGFTFAGSGNATRFDYTNSAVLVFDNSAESARTGNRVAATLGLPSGDVRVSSQGQNVADVLVILGRDYKP